MSNTLETPNRPWLRRLVVTLGPLEEWRGASGQGIEIKSDGTLQTLRIAATVQKTIMAQPMPSQISVYNLSEETRNALKRSLTKITLQAGWENTELRTVFQGSVLNAFSERNGPDIVTKIIALPGYGALVRGVSSAAFGPGAPAITAVTKLAQDLPGVNVSAANMYGITSNLGPQGWAFAGATKDGLTRLAEEHSFSWSIQDGNFVALGDTVALPSRVNLNGENGGLINVAPLLNGPLQMQIGVKIRALYIPGTAPGSAVQVTSQINKGLSGIYRIHTSSVSLDTQAETWYMDLQSFRFGG